MARRIPTLFATLTLAVVPLSATPARAASHPGFAVDVGSAKVPGGHGHRLLVSVDLRCPGQRVFLDVYTPDPAGDGSRAAACSRRRTTVEVDSIKEYAAGSPIQIVLDVRKSDGDRESLATEHQTVTPR
jgi:hypothetical protein